MTTPHDEYQPAGPARGSPAYSILREAGGCAGAKWIARQLSRRNGEDVSVRQVRERLKNYGSIRKLGAGYYVLDGLDLPSVKEHLDHVMAERGLLSVDDAIEEVLQTYPYGDEYAVRCWIHQVYAVR